MKLVLWLILLTGAVWGAEPDDLIAQLNDDDFEIRESATVALGCYSLEWAKRFMIRAAKDENPEIAWRLRLAAKQIYFNHVTAKASDWRTLHGCFPFGGDHTNIFKVENHSGDDGSPSRTCVWVNSGYLVLWVDDSIKDKLHSRDLVMSATDETSMVYWGDVKVEAEKEYTISLRRYKDPESVAQGTAYVDASNLDFTTIEVKIKAVWMDPRQVSWVAEDAIIKRHWAQFCDELEADEQSPPEAAAKH